jgi:Ca2+-binding RTX toxin-like protein
LNAVFFGAFGETDTVNYTFGNKGTTLNSNNNLNNGRLSLPAIENINLLYSDLSANTVLTNVVFASEASTASVRFINVSSASGEDARTSNATDGTGGAISLGTIGARDVRGGVINSNASVSATFNNREGASFSVSGNGDHNLNVENELASSTINAGSATGDVRLAVEAAGANNGRAQFTGGSGDDILLGGNANDILTGNSGNDNLSGNPGIDVLSGGDNQDTLAGGTGNDILTGGSANDRFVQDASGLAASANAAAGVSSSWGTGATLTFSGGLDIVTDFVTGDLIDVNDPTRVSNAFGAASSASFASANTFARGNFAGGVFTIASNGADVLLAPSLGTDIAFNPNTSFILLQGFNADLTAANFT